MLRSTSLATVAALILIGVAWPYANGYQHLGHLAGAYLPPDIFARYHRLVGNDVLVVSGSDTHGTPITVRANEEGVSPREIFERYHQTFLLEIAKRLPQRRPADTELLLQFSLHQLVATF